VLERTGHLDALVNNAGYGLDGAIEEATLRQAMAQFETNYFGVFRMIKAVLPFMRRQSRAYIINISAGNASFRLPFMGHSTATKCAIEALSEVLRREVKPFGINVSIIEPGFFRTNIMDTVQLGEDSVQSYEPWRTQWIDVYRDGIRNGPDPIPVAKCVLRILSSKSPRLFYGVGLGMGLTNWAHRLLPEDLFSLGAYRGIKGMFATGSRK
jgi:NAD(P)-dependent dehydrogenase (short-subunit alcohol dehydrogenase family)